jgi:hypothetical protein
MARSRLRWLFLALVVIAIGFAAMTVLPRSFQATSGPISGATQAVPNVNAGADLHCPNHVECGPDNPAITPAP